MAQSEDEMITQAKALLGLGAKAVLIKGGHGAGAESADFFVTSTQIERLAAPRLATRNTHGTGCSLSAAITAYLAKGFRLIDAMTLAKSWLTEALRAADDLKIGTGAGPVHHFHALWSKL